jgi:predicted HTH transcriptional regulator
MDVTDLPPSLAGALLRQLLPRSETRRLEFKRVSGKMVGKALETVCAFANTQGGTLVLGMADLKEFQGTARLFGVEEIHRDYRLNRDIFVRIFDDRVEVVSPGLLPGTITPATIARAGSKARNPLIAVNLREFPDPPNIDAGEGVPMMFAEMAQTELYPPQYRQTTDAAIESVTVTLFNLKRPSA